MCGDDRTKQVYGELKDKVIASEETQITFTFDIKLLVSDLLEIVGGLRRNKPDQGEVWIKPSFRRPQR